MQTPGAFTWWYADLVDEQGNGAVLIWFFGLPFFPQKSLQRVPNHLAGLTLSVYRNGALDSYAFQTYAPEHTFVNAQQTEWTLGSSFIRLDGPKEQLNLQAALEVPIAGAKAPLIANFSVSGVRVGQVPTVGADPHCTHVWSPMMLKGKGQVAGHYGEEKFSFQGSAYLDRNQSAVPLHDLGISDWHWARIAFQDRTLVLYFLQDEEQVWVQHAFETGSDGVLHLRKVTAFQQQEPKKDRYGIRWSRRMIFKLENCQTPVEVQLSDALEHSPFYMRHMVHAAIGDEIGRGVYERLLPNQIRLKWMQPLMAMRINEWHRSKSMWLPLFEGPSRDRWSRLFRSWGPQPKTRNRRMENAS